MPESNPFITADACQTYRHQLFTPGSAPLLEAVSNEARINIDNRVATAVENIRQLATSPLNVRLVRLAERLEKQGKEVLQQLVENDLNSLNQTADAGLLLEAIIKMDGSRPTFLIRDDRPDLDSNPKGNWENSFIASSNLLEEAIACVGRIESAIFPNRYSGTGFLVADNLLLTNRHVLQAIANLDADGNWQLKAPTQVNFGREFSGAAEKRLRQIDAVIFYGKDHIGKIINHQYLDAALLSLKPVATDQLPTKLVSPFSTTAPASGEIIYVIGYPGPADASIYGQTLLDQLFANSYGHKRISPGLVMAPPEAAHPYSFRHDATTLGGNSGSLVLREGGGLIAHGLHYCGAPGVANFAHAMTAILTLSGQPTTQQLQEVFHDHGI